LAFGLAVLITPTQWHVQVADPGTTVERLDLREALADLPQAQREVLLLKYYVGMDGKEIAGVVGKEPAAVYSLQARGLQSLKRRLG